MFAETTSAALIGVRPHPVRVEVFIGGPRSLFTLVGLPDTAVREARDRVQSAILASGFEFPKRRVTVNLAPANLPKAGSSYDLPIALGVLSAAGLIPAAVDGVVAVGELALDGSLRSAPGGLAAGMVAAERDQLCLTPPQSAEEASLVGGAKVRMVHSLIEAIAVASGQMEGGIPPVPAPTLSDTSDLAEVRGQLHARRALEIAAAGAHHLLLSGPPGSGKTMLARRIVGILPPLNTEDSLEVACIYASGGRLRASPLPPFRDPHHSASLAAMVGGGNGIPVPGEVSLAHRGVLFLDEMAEFPPSVLDALRQPLEESQITIARKGTSVCFPASAQLIAATNPCPCGYKGDRKKACFCAPSGLNRYVRRMSGPLLDRFDLRVKVNRPEVNEFLDRPGESSSIVRQRVLAARERQRTRGSLNRYLDRTTLDSLPFSSSAYDLLGQALSQGNVTARGFDRIRRVARTIADLAGEKEVSAGHAAEAITYRGEW